MFIQKLKITIALLSYSKENLHPSTSNQHPIPCPKIPSKNIQILHQAMGFPMVFPMVAVAPVELGRAAAGEEGLVPQEGRQRVAEAQAPASLTEDVGIDVGIDMGDRNLEEI